MRYCLKGFLKGSNLLLWVYVIGLKVMTTWALLCSLISSSESRFRTTNFRELPHTDKLTIAELPSYNLFEPNGPGTYAFGYEIEDSATNNVQFRDEEKLQNGTVRGSYGLVRPNGLVSITRYYADDTGYHASTQTFSQGDKKPTLLTSTSSPFLEISSPSDVSFLDVPNPATLSPAVAQEILTQHKFELVTPSSNIPITETFSSSDDTDDDNETSLIDRIDIKPQIPGISIPEIPSKGKPSEVLKPSLIFSQSTTTQSTQKSTSPESNKLSDENVSMKPTIISIPSSNIFGGILTHIPKMPSSTETTPTTVTTPSNLADESSQTQSKPSIIGIPQSNIFESILPHIPLLPSSTITTPTSAPTTSSSLADENSQSESKPSIIGIPQNNIFQNILPHIPQLPSSTVTTPTTAPTSSSNLANENNETDSASKPSIIILPQNNIFENILPHIPQLPSPTTEAPTTSSASLSDENSESSSSTNKPTSQSFPGFPNIFENILPNLPFPIPSNMKETTTTTTTPTTPASNDLLDENESEKPEAPLTTKPPSTGSLPSLPPIFSIFNPENFPIFKPPANLLPNRQETTTAPTSTAETASVPAMDIISSDATYPSYSPTDEPIFAIVHKNATIVPIFNDDGTMGIQLINNFIPSNFHIIPFIIPSNYFQSNTPTTPPNIAHDEVIFEENIPAFVNDKFHDPLEEIEDPKWKAKSGRKRKGYKKTKVRRNSQGFKRKRRCRN